MKKFYQLDFQKIRRITQIKDITCFEIYLKNIFSDLAKRDWKDNEGKGVEKIAFIDYMNLPFIVGEKLFNVIDKNRNGFLSQTEFVSGIINLYMGALEETQKVIFNMLDFDLDGIIIPEDSRLLISFIKHLANPPQKVMKLKPRNTLKDEENLEEINLIIRNFFNNKKQLNFEEYKNNIENINSDVFFLFICFLYNNRPFTDSSIKILKLLNKSNIVSSLSSNYISCSSDDCTQGFKSRVRRPSKVIKSFILDLVNFDLDDMQRDCEENSDDENDNNIDEGTINNLINENLNKITLPEMNTNINLHRLKKNKDYLTNDENNKYSFGALGIKNTYENFLNRQTSLKLKGKDSEEIYELTNEIKKLKINESKNYLNENEDLTQEKGILEKDINRNLINNENKSNNRIHIPIENNEFVDHSTEASVKINKSQFGQSEGSSSKRNLKKGNKSLPTCPKILEEKIDINLLKRNSIENFPKIEISRNFDNIKLNNNDYSNINNYNNNSMQFGSNQNLSNDISNYSASQKHMENTSSNNLNPSINSSFNEDIPLADIVYENYIFKSRNNNKLKKYYIVLIGMDIFYFSNSKKEKLRGMHNLSGSYIYEDDNVIKVREENAKNKNEPTTVFYYPFKLYFKKKARIYYCPNEDEAKMWVKHIRNITNFREVKDFYDFGEDLGAGKFGKVKLGYNKNSKKKVAIKTIDKTKLKGTEVEMVKTEIEIMKFCRHKNIVRLIDNFEDMENIYIVLEYLSGGNLNFFLSQQQTLLTEERIKDLILQMANGISYLHNFGIIHRDLKPENTMMTDGSEKAYIKIVDFGLSKILGINEKSNEAYGTLSYAAPEVIQKSEYNNKVDVWSLGIIMFFLITGNLPFNDKNNNFGKIASEIAKKPLKFEPVIWNRISNDPKDLVTRCLERDIKKRYNILEILEHPWFAK